MDELNKVDETPYIWSTYMENSKESYFATYKTLGRNHDYVNSYLRTRFPLEHITVCEDYSMRGYFIFVNPK
jgi:hypothetical protein